MKLPHTSRIICFLIAILAVISVTVAATQPAMASSLLGAVSSSSSSSHPTLQYGARGTTVKTAQGALNKHGARLAVDGVFGPATRTATKSFQASHKLVTDGVIGPLTWSALLGTKSAPPKPTPPSSSLTKLGITQTAINGARINGASLDISKKTHMLYFLQYSGGKVHISISSVVSFAGCNPDGCFHTPSGVFRVVRKGGANERSAMWHNASMPYPVYFTWSGYAVHFDPLEPSHGCIHVPYYQKMAGINREMPTGGVVVVHS